MKVNLKKLAQYEGVMENEFQWTPGTREVARVALRYLPEDVSYKNLTEDHIKAVEARMVEKLKPKTIRMRKIHIRRFLRWINGDEEDHPAIPNYWRKRLNKGIRARRQEDKVTYIRIPDEVFDRMMNATDSIRDKAMLTLLRRGGLRAGELLSLNIGHWEVLNDIQALIHIPDIEGVKTGARTVPVSDRAIVEVENWLRSHPNRSDREAPMFLAARGNRLTYEGLRKVWSRILEQMAREGVGFPKGMTPHDLRHTRAFEWKENNEGGTEDMMTFFGWTSSGMCIQYGKRNGGDMLRKWEENKGIKPKSRVVGTAGTIPCPDCGKRLGKDYGFCPWCGEDLNKPRKIEDTAEDIEAMKAQITELRDFLASLGMKPGVKPWTEEIQKDVARELIKNKD